MKDLKKELLDKHTARRKKLVDSMKSGDYTRDFTDDIQDYMDMAEKGESLEDREKEAEIKFRRIKKKLGAI